MDSFELLKPQTIVPSTLLADSIKKDQLPLVFLIDHLCYPHDLMTNTYWENEMGNEVLVMRQYVVGYFCRELIDRKFALFPLPKRNKQLREMVEVTGALWIATWECLERLSSLGLLKISPAEALFHLVTENDFLMPFFFHDDPKKPITGRYLSRFSARSNDPEKKGARARPGGNPFCRAIQLENGCLSGLKNDPHMRRVGRNPFPGGFTRQFIDICLEAAEADQFRKTRYLPMIKARSALVSTLIKQGAQPYGAGRKAENRGKHSKTTPKNIPTV